MSFYELAKEIRDLDFHPLIHLDYPPKGDPRDTELPDLPVNMDEAKNVADLVRAALFDAEESLVCRNIYALQVYGIKVSAGEHHMAVAAIIEGERSFLIVTSRDWHFHFLGAGI